MRNTTKLLIKHLLETALDNLDAGNTNISEDEGLNLIESLQEILYPKPKIDVVNITQACQILGISQPTFRKYITEGIIPEGIKISGFTEKVWDKSIINNLNLKEMACKGGKKTKGKGGKC